MGASPLQMKGSRRRHWAWDTGAALAVLLLPLVIFFRHNDYPLASVEFVLACLPVLVFAVFAGIIMGQGRWAKIAMVTFILILLVDIQTSWLTTINLRLGLCVLFFGGASWFLKRRLSLVINIVFGAMILGTIVQPPGKVVRFSESEIPTGAQEQPFLLHIILDEYAAPEALDQTFDVEGEVAAEISRFFTTNGFRLYSRAYSRLVITAESIPAILNPGLPTTANEYWPQGWAKGRLLKSNAWFKRLENLGYGLHVVQSDFLRYLDQNSAEDWPARTVLTHYTAESIHALAGTSLSAAEKLSHILGAYCRLSWLLSMGRDVYTDFRLRFGEEMPGLSDWDRADGLVSPLTSMEVGERMVSDLKSVQAGQAVVAHLLLPHFPYAFTADCSLAPMGRKWLNSYAKDAYPARNTLASRADRYPHYLAQIRCTNLLLSNMFDALREAGVWDNAIIVLHGDHGSRLNLSNPLPETRDQMSNSDFAEAFGTLLAIKLPGEPGLVDRSQVALDDFFEQVFLRENASWPPPSYEPDPKALAEPWIILTNRQDSLIKVPLPEFANGGAKTSQ